MRESASRNKCRQPGNWHLWQRTDLNKSHLHLRVPPHYARAGVRVDHHVIPDTFATVIMTTGGAKKIRLFHIFNVEICHYRGAPF